jgi:hypothetical protein
MPYVFFNNNPKNARVGDCSVRAVSKAIGQSWQDAYIGLCAEGLAYKDMPSANYVWGMYLKKYGFEERMISSICPNCVTVSQFAKDHSNGRYVLACQNHVVTVIDGDYFDTWDSGNEIVLYYYKKEI